MGFTMLSLTGKLDIGSVLFVLIALGFRGYLLWRDREFNVPERWTSYLTLGYVAIYALDYLVISRGDNAFVTATVHLVIFSLVAKIFSVHRERDYLYLCVLAFLMVLASAVLTVDTLFFIEFAVFVLLSISTAIAMEMRRSLHEASSEPALRSNANGVAAIPQRRFAASLSRVATAMLFSILAVGVLIFFLLPRLSAGYLSSLAAQSTITSGFSDDVRLGEIGRIQQSDAVVMHVTFQGPPPPDLKWRGIALSTFDGTRWSNPAKPVTVKLSSSELVTLTRLRDTRASRTLAHELPNAHWYTVMMEPMTTSVFFLVPEALTVTGPYRFLEIDAVGNVYNGDRDHGVTRYRAAFDPMLRAEIANMPDRSDYPPDIAIADLQLPRLDPRIPALARQITRGADTNVKRALAIESFLRSNYSYTLQLLDREQRDPLAYFLFTRKKGHCEYFASSMAVLLRTLGIPSRVVNGFRDGEYNDINATYIVRARDAHAWVEAYFPGYGWATFDPTPAAEAPPKTEWNRMMLYLDAGREFWREWIINYDFAHRRDLADRVGQTSKTAVRDWRQWTRHIYHLLLHRIRTAQTAASSAPLAWTLRIALLVLIIIAAVNGRALAAILHNSFRNLRFSRHPAAAPSQAAAVWYQRTLRLLARRGYEKKPAHTPTEFAATVLDPRLQAPLRRFTETYERARFADSQEHAKQLPQAFEEVEAALDHRKEAP